MHAYQPSPQPLPPPQPPPPQPLQSTEATQPTEPTEPPQTAPAFSWPPAPAHGLAVSGLLQRLKSATQARHVALESRSVLLDPQLSHTLYLANLRRFFGYYAPLERAMLRSPAWSQTGLGYEGRHKTALLRRDLLALGDTEEGLARAPQCHSLPGVASAADIFGCLYVIEGATLGGQIITRHLQQRLGLTPEAGGAFFGGYGPRTGSQWRAFGQDLLCFARLADRDDEIVASADKTFETLDRWLYPT